MSVRWWIGWWLGLGLSGVSGVGLAQPPAIQVDVTSNAQGSRIAAHGDDFRMSVTSATVERSDAWSHPAPSADMSITDHRLAADVGWSAAGLDVTARVDWRNLAPRPMFGFEHREGMAFGATLGKRWSRGGVRVSWDDFGTGYARPDNLWFADDRARWSFEGDHRIGAGRLLAGLEQQSERQSSRTATQSQRRWLGWQAPVSDRSHVHAQLEQVDRQPHGEATGYRRQRESRIRLGGSHDNDTLHLSLHTEYFEQATDAATPRALRAALGSVSARVTLPGPDWRAWAFASRHQATHGVDAVVHGGMAMIAGSDDRGLFAEVGLDHAERDYAWAPAPIMESHVRGRLRWSPSIPASLHRLGHSRQRLEVVADVRRVDAGGGVRVDDPTLTMMWTLH